MDFSGTMAAIKDLTLGGSSRLKEYHSTLDEYNESELNYYGPYSGPNFKRPLVLTKNRDTEKNRSVIAMVLMLCNADFTVSLPWLLIYKILEFFPEGDYHYWDVTVSKYDNFLPVSRPLIVDNYGNHWVKCKFFGQHLKFSFSHEFCQNYLCVYSPDDYLDVIPYDADETNPYSESHISNIACKICKDNNKAQDEYYDDYNDRFYNYDKDNVVYDEDKDRCDRCGYYNYGRMCAFCEKHLINF